MSPEYDKMSEECQKRGFLGPNVLLVHFRAKIGRIRPRKTLPGKMSFHLSWIFFLHIFLGNPQRDPRNSLSLLECSEQG